MPAKVVTETSTAPAEPAGVTAIICDEPLTKTDVAAVEPKFTVASVKFVPVMTTLSPPAVEPDAGETLVMDAGGT